MGRKMNGQRLDDIREAIIRQPGQRPGYIARRLGFDNKTMMRALGLMEARGDLLAEDDRGRLSWYGQRAVSYE